MTEMRENARNLANFVHFSPFFGRQPNRMGLRPFMSILTHFMTFFEAEGLSGTLAGPKDGPKTTKMW